MNIRTKYPEKGLCLFLSWFAFVMTFPVSIKAQNVTDIAAREEKASIVVLDMEGKGISRLEAASLTSFMRSELEGTGLVSTAGTGEIEGILEELGLGDVGCASADCALEIGRLLGVSSVVIGSVEKQEETYYLGCRMFDVGRGIEEKTVNRTFTGTVDGLIVTIQRLVRDVVGLPPAPSVTFTSSNWRTPQLVTISGIDDDVDDGDQPYTIVTGTVVSDDANYYIIDPLDVSLTNTDDDEVGIVVQPTTGLVTTELGETDTFTVVLTSEPTSDVVLSLNSSDESEGTASPPQLSFNSQNWNVEQVILVSGVNDDMDDGDQEYTAIIDVSSSDDPLYGDLDPDNVSVTNADDDEAGIRVHPTDGLVTTEAGLSGTFSIVLTSEPTEELSIPIENSDTTEASISLLSVTFDSDNWNIPQTIVITGIDDDTVDGNQNYNIVVDPVVSEDPVYDGINPDDVFVRNVDDQPAIVVHPARGLTTAEDDGVTSFIIVLASRPEADVTLSLSSSDDSEGALLPSSVMFTIDDWDTPQSITVSGIDDTEDDGDQSYSVIIEAASSADTNYNFLNPEDLAIINIDDDISGIKVDPTNELVTTERGGGTMFSVSLTSKPTADVTMSVGTSDDTEGLAYPASLRFTPYDWDLPQSISIMGIDDDMDDGDVGFVITMGATITTTDVNYRTVDAYTIPATNANDDSHGITITPPGGLTTTEAGDTDSFTVALTSEPVAQVIVPLSSPDTTEGRIWPSSLVFSAANWGIPQTVTVTGIDDDMDDGDQPYRVVVDAAVSEDPNYGGLNSDEVSVTNTDDDTWGVIIVPLAGLVLDEFGGDTSFTIVLNSKPSAHISFSLSSTDTAEVTATPQSLTFTSGDWNIPRVITVAGIDDDFEDGDQDVTVVINSAVSEDQNYSGFDPDDVSLTNRDDDEAGITLNPGSGLTTSESGGTAQFSAVLESEPTADVILSFGSSDTSEGRVSPDSITFTRMNWDTVQAVTVTGVDDDVDDGEQPYTIEILSIFSNDSNYAGLEPEDVYVTNSDDDAAGFAVIPGTGLITAEAGRADSFSVSLTSQPAAEVFLSLSSSDTTEGFVSPSLLTFTEDDWTVSQTVVITGLEDADEEGQNYGILLDPTASEDDVYGSLNPTEVSVTNKEGVGPGILVEPAEGLTTSEAGSTATFTVVLTSEPEDRVTLSLSSSDETEGTPSPSVLKFNPRGFLSKGNWNVPHTVTVSGLDDLVEDGDQFFTVVVNAAISSDPDYSGLKPDDVTATNMDDDEAGIAIDATPGLATTESGGSADFSMSLTSQPTAEVTVSVNSSDITEGMVSPSSLVFTHANWNVSQTVTVTGMNDDVEDGDQDYEIVTEAAISDDENYDGFDSDDVSAMNTDDDEAGISVEPVSGLVTSETGRTARFNVFLNSEPVSDVTLSLNSSDQTEGTVSPESIGFSDANWNIPQRVTVMGADDDVDDGEADFTVIVGATITSSDANYVALNPSTVSATNIDDDTKGILVTPAHRLSTSESGGTATFTIGLASQPVADVSIELSSTDTSEGIVSSSSVTFTPGNWSESQTITVSGVDDDVYFEDPEYQIVIEEAVSDDPGYDGVDPDDVLLVNKDDDSPGIVVYPTGGLITTEAGGSASFAVVLVSEPIGDVTFSLFSSDESEGTISPLSVTFTTDDWSTPQTVTISGMDDDLDDGDEIYTIVVDAAVSADRFYNGYDPFDVMVTNVNDDESGITLDPNAGLTTTETGDTVSIGATLTSEPLKNVTFSLRSSDVTEGSVYPSLLTFTQDNWDSTQIFAVIGIDDDMDDGDREYTVVVDSAISMDPTYSGLDPDDLFVTNSDDDEPGITVNPQGILSISEDGSEFPFSIVLNTQPVTDVMFAVRCSDTTEGALYPSVVTFTPDTWSVPQSLTLTGIDDKVDDGDQSLSVIVEPGVSQDPNYSGLDPEDIPVSNMDDDSAGIFVYPSAGVTTDESGTQDMFTLVLATEPTEPVTLSLASSDTTEGIVSPPLVTFTSDNWDSSQSISVTGVDDDEIDGDQPFSVLVEASVTDDENYGVLSPTTVSAINTDDQEPEIKVEMTSGLITTEAGSADTFTVVLTVKPTASVTVSFSSSDSTEGIVSPSSTTFTERNWFTPQLITVTGVDEFIDDGDQVYDIVTHPAVAHDRYYGGQDPEDVSVTNIDDDEAGINLEPVSGLLTTERRGRATFSVVLASEPVADVTLSLNTSDATEGVLWPFADFQEEVAPPVAGWGTRFWFWVKGNRKVLLVAAAVGGAAAIAISGQEAIIPSTPPDFPPPEKFSSPFSSLNH